MQSPCLKLELHIVGIRLTAQIIAISFRKYVQRIYLLCDVIVAHDHAQKANTVHEATRNVK